MRLGVRVRGRSKRRVSMLLARVVQAGGDAVHGRANGVVECWVGGAGALAARAGRPESGSADRRTGCAGARSATGRDSSPVSSCCSFYRENLACACVRIPRAAWSKTRSRSACVGDEVGVEAGDGEVGFGHGEFHVAEQAVEQRKALHHFAQQLGVGVPRLVKRSRAWPTPNQAGTA